MLDSSTNAPHDLRGCLSKARDLTHKQSGKSAPSSCHAGDGNNANLSVVAIIFFSYARFFFPPVQKQHNLSLFLRPLFASPD
ncbi:uncharacterized protein RCC_06287 [Ramularia collo-cygni]|uniref:Uncharacterized protein n=1 Tax=Ramularia collo-cygni TaxID=112498 RepID=A0A2D3V6T1_9PEZI|nr:uncharacterized protein RCC_06287 [Ramularia collo-cygni]CZT20427.1 uncharacterized protein RCC_06287 [Ramularia collo-cygni]